MPAKGKINAAGIAQSVAAGTPVRVLVDVTESGALVATNRKTGVEIVTIVKAEAFQTSGGFHRSGRVYNLTARDGRMVKGAGPIQTFIEAEETPAAVKRAHIEALEIERERNDRAFLEATATLATDPEVRAEAQELLEAEPMTTEDVSRIFDVPAELIETTPAEEPDPVATQPLPPAETAPAGAGSSVVTVLEKVWNQIRANHSELPEVVIVTGSGMIGPARWGHFRANGWTERAEKEAAVSLVLGEMFVAGETLARGAAHTLETMLHEAAHVLAKVRDIKDTSRQNRWHNQKFRTLAEELGLEYAKASAHPQIGFSEVTLTPGTTEEYAEVIEELDKAIRLTVALPEFLRVSTEGDDQEKGSGESMGHHGGRRPRTGMPAPNSNNVKATCGCEEPRIIRASRKVLEGARITCEECGEAFMDRS